MTRVHVVSSSWRGLFALLAVAGAVIWGVVWGIGQIAGQVEATEQRVRDEFLDPYLAALQTGDVTSAWQGLTTESYRERHTLAAFTANAGTVLARYGKPLSARIAHATATVEPDRSYHRVQVEWTWTDGRRFTRTFQLVDVPGTGFRLDGATLGGRGINVLPDDVPDGPW